MGKTLVVLLTAVAAGLLLYFLASPYFLPAPPHTTSSSPIRSQSAGNASESAPSHSVSTPEASTPNLSVSSPGPIAAPRSPQERENDDLESRRAPFYAWLRQNMSDLLTGWQPAKDDVATLNLYLSRNDARLVTQAMNQAITPYATRYGFRRVRFYLPNPPGSDETYRIDTEATPDDQGNWHAYRK